MTQLPATGEATFRAGPFVNLASTLSSLGCDPTSTFRKAGFEPGDFDDPDRRHSYLRGSHLLAACVKASGCDHIGLLLGQRANPSHLGISGFLARAAPTVRHALLAFVENMDLHDEGGNATLETGPEYTTLGFHLTLSGLSAVDQIYDLAAALLCQVMRTLCPSDWAASCVKLPRREPRSATPYHRYFGAPLYFNATVCSVTFPNHYLEQSPPGTDELLFKHLEAESRQLHNLQQHEILDELPAALRKGLLIGQFTAHDIAAVFGIHERTLHRRLKSAGTGFRAELDKVRRSVSEQLLGATSLATYDIANALGYSDSTGFIRAFQRWTGNSPSRWRRLNGRRSAGSLNSVR